MSKAWVTCWYCVAGSPPFSRPGVRPQFSTRPAVTSNSLPKSHAPTFLPASVADVGGAAVLPGDRQGAGALEDLGDVDEVGARLAGLEDLRHPRDRELGPVGRRADLLRDDRRAAVEDLDGEPLGGEVALLVGGEVAGELGLRRPLELQADVRRLGRRRAGLDRGLAGGGLDAGALGRCRARGSRGRGRPLEHAATSDRRRHASPRTRDCFLMPLLCCGRPARMGRPLLLPRRDAADQRNDTESGPRERPFADRAWIAGCAPSALVPRPSCATGSRLARRGRSAGRTRCRRRRRARPPPT